MFICTIVEDADISIHGLAGNNENVVVLPLGYDDESGNVFSALVALSILPGFEDVELTVTIVEASSDGEPVSEKTDGLETKGVFASSDDRALIRLAIQTGTDHLFDEVSPLSVRMYTFKSDLPRKALEKYNQLAAIAMEKGYTVTREKPWHGQHGWVMTRLADATVEVS